MAFGLGDFLLSGSHGLEHARPGQSAEAMDRPLAIDFVLEKLRIFASVRPGILVEEKTLGAGLHFRLAPQYEADCLSFRSEEHTSELQSLMRISYAVFCLKKKKTLIQITKIHDNNTTKYNK